MFHKSAVELMQLNDTLCLVNFSALKSKPISTVFLISSEEIQALALFVDVFLYHFNLGFAVRFTE